MKQDKKKKDEAKINLIGESDLIRNIRQEVEKVAKTDKTVLIQGPTGTGKELIAHDIHKKSPRNNGPFIVLNCSAIPTELFESELFGHEKGSFTGATENKDGKVKLADMGTLFLDEIGDLRQ